MNLLDDIPEGVPVALDTAPWIYEVEANATFWPIVHPLFVDRFKLGKNRVALELRVLRAVAEATGGLGATLPFNFGTDDEGRSWLVRERVFDLPSRGSQAARTKLVEIVLRILPNADVSLLILPDPTFDNVRWGHTQDNPEPRWILIDP